VSLFSVSDHYRVKFSFRSILCQILSDQYCGKYFRINTVSNTFSFQINTVINTLSAYFHSFVILFPVSEIQINTVSNQYFIFLLGLR
jgi:hypothetical protein